jgi:uncharacterized protein YprB with RNaseH-like and TPR domain
MPRNEVIGLADVFIDCEWVNGDSITILGAYSPGQERFQLYGDTLTRNRFSRFLNKCCDRNPNRYTLLFCHGPDIGKLRNQFGLKLKRNYYCINTVTAFRNFTQFKDCSLGHLEQHFGVPRENALSSYEITHFWNSGKCKEKKIVLGYNWEDCVNLWRLVNILKRDYDVTRSDLKSISMEQ